MKFSQYSFSPDIKKNLEGLGFNRPTDIQYKAIPPIVRGEDVLAIAQTGTGKTAAFAIPIIDKLHKSKKSRRSEEIKCVVMVPTRELAIQITEVFQELGKHTKVTSFCVFGGVEQAPQIASLEDGIDILITTPGRMFDLVSQGHIYLDKVETLVLDEADHMLDLGFIKDIQDLIRYLPKKRQTLFFSATITPKIKKLAYSLVRSAIRIQISPKDPVSKNVEHGVAFVSMDDKRFFLERLIKEHIDSKILVFVRTKIRAERVHKAMERVDIISQTIHGDRNQDDRLLALEAFKSGKVKVLIATDVSARGIDIANVDYVVNYDMPDVAENYVHRVGRTGRGVQKGLAISFCCPEEEQNLLTDIQEYTGTEIQVMDISKGEYTATIDFSEDYSKSLKELMDEAEDFMQTPKKKNAKKKAVKKPKKKKK
ncbi:DEAD/DEAH box helicase [Labilibaculum sp. DW002]|uniref:DEAD/DEAH box helicase n=1 Tax=Paralabilibaculum antarcticum TaxID=2912572 RepID=A0ABT5VPJ3_9BACT|nr:MULTISPECIES: DEAD/DEAH box helicase [unclassified Labilibaculum]MBI9058587.1 DEAD/DEAH box helicase [Labilibaculum sp.]MDE5416398.1 DEAD/DEAH box helicase [Labilibaculum sp. DW002]|eukprot:TRINITY_DN4827_c0_g2_i1.p1 TRINITY_DN4827_c0_g2~~TRINITY_DN4827_c0_g2_i1.p1  ORF type:complete len:425 (-),score=70.41 TRINITY_DN4827_c0_g2_i1:130-1404(-)